MVLLNMSLAIAGISLGFIGTMIGVFLSIMDTNVMCQIYKHNADKILIRYIAEAAILNLILFAISTVFLLWADEGAPDLIFSSVWLLVFVMAVLCSFRIIHLLFKIMCVINRIEYKKFMEKSQQSAFQYDEKQIQIPDLEKEDR